MLVMRVLYALLASLMSSLDDASDPRPALPDLYEASVTELQVGLDAGHFTSVYLVKAYLARIDEVNLKGPELRAVLEINPSALGQAAILDKERERFGRRSLLHGIPVLLKDNIATNVSEGMNTTAGSFGLLRSIVPDDAGVVKRLRKAGAIILGTRPLITSLFLDAISKILTPAARENQLIRILSGTRQVGFRMVRTRWTRYRRLLSSCGPLRVIQWFRRRCFNRTRSNYARFRDGWEYHLSLE